jgi:hypothetical protein
MFHSLGSISAGLGLDILSVVIAVLSLVHTLLSLFVRAD